MGRNERHRCGHNVPVDFLAQTSERSVRGVTPQPVLFSHHPRIVYHWHRAHHLWCATVARPTMSNNSSLFSTIALWTCGGAHVARGVSRVLFTEIFLKDPSSACGTPALQCLDPGTSDMLSELVTTTPTTTNRRSNSERKNNESSNSERRYNEKSNNET